MPSKVHGPFLKFDCEKCGRTVQAAASRNPDRLVDQIADLNADANKRICASCWQP